MYGVGLPLPAPARPIEVQRAADGTGWRYAVATVAVEAVVECTTVAATGLPRVVVRVVGAAAGITVRHPGGLAGLGLEGLVYGQQRPVVTAFPTAVGAGPEVLRGVTGIRHALGPVHSAGGELATTMRAEGGEGGYASWRMIDCRSAVDNAFASRVPTQQCGDGGGAACTLTIDVHAAPGATPGREMAEPRAPVRVALRPPGREVRVPPVALGLPCDGDLGRGLEQPEVAERDVAVAVQAAGARHVWARHDALSGHGVLQLQQLRRLGERAEAMVVLELVVRPDATGSVERCVETALTQLDAAKLWPRLSALLPLPGEGGLAPGPERMAALSARLACALAERGRRPRVRVLGGVAGGVAALLRSPPSAAAVDGVAHTLESAVHDASDEAVLAGLPAAATAAAAARATCPGGEHWVGPSLLGVRGDPHQRPEALQRGEGRVAGVDVDPRLRGGFGAAYALGLVARLAPQDLGCLGLGDVTGRRGLTAPEFGEAVDTAPLWCQSSYIQPRAGRTRQARTRYFPAYHVVRGVGRARGAVLWDALSSAPEEVTAFAFHVPLPGEVPGGGSPGHHRFEQRRDSIGGSWHDAVDAGAFVGELWLANMTTERRDVHVELGCGASFHVALLDHTATAEHADYDPAFLDQTLSSQILSRSPDPSKLLLELGPFAVARVVVGPLQRSEWG